jgi:Putative adhesin/Domain of unknown function (DUF5668)
MARTQSRSSGLFSGLVLISAGLLLLLHNYGHLDFGAFFVHWWPLLIIFWGVVKLYERTAGRRFGGSDGGAVSAGEVFLVLGMLALLALVVGYDYTKKEVVDKLGIEVSGDDHTFDMEAPPPQTIPPNARVSVKLGRGDLTIRGSEDAQLRISAKKNAKTWNEAEAERLTKPVGVEIVKNGDAYEVHPTGYDLSNSRLSVNLELSIPRKSPLTLKTEKGDITVSGVASDVSISVQSGDVDLRDITGEISVETRKGDVKAADINGDVKVSGRGGEIGVNNCTGSLTVDGDFYGPVRGDKIAKGVRLISAKTDLTLSALSGHMEAGSGNLDIVDVPGLLDLRTRDMEVNLENPGGKVKIDDRNADIGVRYSSVPKEDVTISNSSAAISLTLPGSSSFDIQADCRNCEISSEFAGLQVAKSPSGDSSLAGKFGSGRGPKIILKTSYGNIAIRRTTVALPPKPGAPPQPPTPIPPAVEQ